MCLKHLLTQLSLYISLISKENLLIFNSYIYVQDFHILLGIYPVVPDLGEKPEKAADGRGFPITVLSSLSPVPPL